MQTTQATNPQNIQNNPISTLPPAGAPKSYGSGSSPKALGGGGDPALAQWYEQAYAYYNAVQSGQSPMPDQAAWNDFLNQMNWAYQTLNGGGGLPPMGDPAQGAQSGMPQEMQYDYESNEITATGEPMTHRSWGLDDTLIIPSMAAHVEYIWTTDNSVTPAQQVLKVKIVNEITGSEEIVTFENAGDPDFHLTIKAADTKAVTGTAPGIDITVEKYDMKKAGEKSQAAGETASVPGELNEDGVWEYFGEGESTINFQPVGDPEDPQEHVFYGYVNIQVPGGSTIDYHMEGDDIVGVIKNHKGEITDTIRVKKGYTIDTQGHPAYILFDGKSFDELGGVPPEFDGRIMVGGSDQGEAIETSGLNALMDELGIEDMDTIIDALNKAGIKTADGKSFETVGDVQEAIKDGILPPEEINSNIVYFLSLIDPSLNELAKEAHDVWKSGGINDDEELALTQRVVELLNTLYAGEKDFEVWDKTESGDGGPAFVVDGYTYALRHEEGPMQNWLVRSDGEGFSSGDEIKTDKGDGWK